MPDKRDDSQRFDDKAWLDLFEPLYYAVDTGVADRAAKLFDNLLIGLESGGSRGATDAAVCIENALRLIFPFTGFGRTCLVLFQVSLGKDFPTQSDELAALSEAMKRTRAALERSTVRQTRKRKQSRLRK